MSNQLEGMSSGAKWRLLVDAAKKAAEAKGYKLKRIPGRGLSNVWNMDRDGEVKATAIRTTWDRWIAFPPLEQGTNWKTLNDVELVLVAAADDREDPQNVQVYLFNATEVRAKFDAAYAARIDDGQSIPDNFGMWVALDPDGRGIARSVGSGLAAKHEPLVVYSIASLTQHSTGGKAATKVSEIAAEASDIRAKDEPPLSIAEAKRRLALSLGVDPAHIKITIEA